jgi:hypothetical protein
VGAAEALVKYKDLEGDTRAEGPVKGDEVVYVLGRRRHHERGRVLGGHEHGLQPEAPGAVPDRGQRLRDLGAGGRADGGRQRRASW